MAIGSTDIWGISLSPSAGEQGTMAEAELERGITLLHACWAYFAAIAARVSSEMRKGPRGGGRDRDRIARHTIRTESEDFANTDADCLAGEQPLERVEDRTLPGARRADGQARTPGGEPPLFVEPAV